MHFKYENLKNYAPINIAYCSFERLGVPLFVGANFIMEKIEYYKNLSLELLTGYDLEGNFYVEEFRDVPNYEGHYQASTFGRIKSLKIRDGICEKIISSTLHWRGYCVITLGSSNTVKKKKQHRTHRLIASTFLPNPGNKPDVNHIDLIKTNCCAWNLEWITKRRNSIHYHSSDISFKASSKYIGVRWHQRTQNWDARITLNKKSIFLGYFDTDTDAHNAYQKALKEIEDNTFIPPYRKGKSSEYKGVSFIKTNNMWIAYTSTSGNKKRISLGYFLTEDKAHEAIVQKQITC